MKSIFPIVLLFLFIEGLIGQPTFYKDIAPIVYNNCAVCHRSGEIGPMPLTNYQEVKNYAATIKYVTGIKYMPPWKPDPNYSKLLFDRHLTDDQIKLISDWVNAGSPEGNKADEPFFPDFPTGSALGEPDLVLSFAQSYTHKGNNRDNYRYFVLPTGLTEDKIIKAVEMRPGNRKIVHHALMFEDTTGKAAANDAKTPEYGFDGFGGFTGDSDESILTQKQFPGYVPGQKASFYPDGLGQKLSKGADLVVQVHYAPWPVDEVDSSSVNIFFADENEVVDREVRNHIMVPLPGVLVGDIFVIPANQVKRFHGVYEVPVDVSLIGITPHMHLLGQEWEVYVEHKDGRRTNLISIPDWDFNWQGGYFFDRFIVAEKGSKIHAYASYDNTSENPNNPNNPPRWVSWGEGTEDEMYYLPISYVLYRDGDENIRFDQTSSTDNEELLNKYGIEPLSPNPVLDDVEVKFNLQKGAPITIEILDINGQRIRTIRQSEFFSFGPQLVNFRSSSLADGIYLLHIYNHEFSMTQKFVKAK